MTTDCASQMPASVRSSAMPIPWLAALKVIPWGTLLAGAPALARAADALLSGAKARSSDRASTSDLQSLAARVAFLEQQDRADAEMLKQVADQMAALTTASEVLAARLRWVLVLSIAALGVAVVAVTLALIVGWR